MQEQNFKNHVRLVPLFHFFLLAIDIAALILAIINGVSAFNNDTGILLAVLYLLITVALLISFLKIRQFPIAAQDRAIRAEENLRHFALTGKLLDSRLTMSQIIALRFAADNELVGLAERAVHENLSNSEIKKLVKNWRPDHHRA
jgi:hypothetical protein